MTFSLRGMLVLVAFLAALAVAVGARESAAAWLGVGGVAAVVLIDWVLTFWPVVGRR